jgi:predicted Holliday junction resolvase-like endonuclease
MIELIATYIVGLAALIGLALAGKSWNSAIKRAAEADDRYGKLLHLKKSSETRIGLVGEQLSPYLQKWPFDDARQFRLISSPIDGVNFGQDEVTFVEIKTGKSRLSKSQKRVRELVRQGKVAYIEFRVGENGCEVKRTAPGKSTVRI